MSYLTRYEAVTASRARWFTESAAKMELRKSASAPMSESFDIFLSHAYEDAELISGVAALIEQDGLKVYIDWKVDVGLDRSEVTAANADIIRRRMQKCRFMLYVSSSAATTSRWMPWELGYFDGFSSGKVGVLPVVRSSGEGFGDQQYLGLYPTYELVNFLNRSERFGRFVGKSPASALKDDARAA